MLGWLPRCRGPPPESSGRIRRWRKVSLISSRRKRNRNRKTKNSRIRRHSRGRRKKEELKNLKTCG